ncbi:MAG: TIGR04282 family arsenosugar biosynthesis glycosyltransferase [Gemmatimonadales bacterium]
MADRSVLAVFVKAPVPGHVKTRLAAAIGSRRAAALYRRIAHATVRAAGRGAHQTVVWYAPPGHGSVVRAWLEGTGVLRFEPQPAGDLGGRLAAMFACHFQEGAGRVVAIGSDCPGLEPRLIESAFDALGRRDVVLGPAHDGGYYLIGLRAPAAPLFQGIAWSSSRVFGETVARLRALRLSHQLLPALRDLDTLADAHALGLLEPAR